MTSNSVALPNKLYDDVLRDVIENNLKRPIDDFKVTYNMGSVKGDNYVGIVYRVEVEDKETDECKLSVIIKVSPENPTRRSEFMINKFFAREINFYDNIYPLYKEFQESKGIDIENDGFYQVPLCYKTVNQEPFEALYFQDLKTLDFVMYDRLQELTKEHVFLVMKSLAKMHAIFYCIKDQSPKQAAPHMEMKDLFMELKCVGNDSIATWFESLKDQANEVFEKLNDEEMQKRIKKILDKNFFEACDGCFDRNNFEPYGTLCHGDCWNNNILYRNNEDGSPVDLRLLDFQIMRYASPVCDLMYYIFGCTTKTLRDKHYQDFLNTYHTELSSFIKRLGSDPEKLFPRSAFEDHLKKFGHFGLIMGLLVLPFFTTNAEDAPDMDDLAEKFKNLSDGDKSNGNHLGFNMKNNYDKYAERLTGICQDMYELGYI